MKSRKLISLFLASVMAAPVLAADVGEAVMVRNEVKGTSPGGAAKAMTVGDGVMLGYQIATAVDSSMKMTFDPQGALTLGPETKLTVDQTVVDRATGRSTSTLSMGIGRLRVALGKLFGGEVDVQTPSAVVGIKGTDVLIIVDISGRTTVIVFEGTVTVKSRKGGAPSEAPEGTRAVAEVDGNVLTGLPFDHPAGELLGAGPTGLGNLPVPPALRPQGQGGTGNVAGMAGRPGGKGTTGGNQGKGAGTTLAIATLSAAAGGPGSANSPGPQYPAIPPVLFLGVGFQGCPPQLCGR